MTIMHAEVKIRKSIVMISEATAEHKAMPAMVYVHLEECDKYFDRAVNTGAKSIIEPADQPYGDRMSGVQDASENQWWIACSL